MRRGLTARMRSYSMPSRSGTDGRKLCTITSAPSTRRRSTPSPPRPFRSRPKPRLLRLAPGEAANHAAPARPLQVEADALLVAVDPEEGAALARQGRGIVAEVVPFGRL